LLRSEAHAVGLGEGDSSVGFEEFVVGVDLDRKIFAWRDGIGGFEVTAPCAEIANLEGQAEIGLGVENFRGRVERNSRRGAKTSSGHLTVIPTIQCGSRPLQGGA
jgi:hypothetical protein